MKSTYTLPVVCLVLAGTVLAVPGPPISAALASCVCDTELFSLSDLTDALNAAVATRLIPKSGHVYPHNYRNGEELSFPWCKSTLPFAEFPLTKPTFSNSGPPGAYRLIYDYIGQKICGCVKHAPISSLDDDYSLCVHEGDPDPPEQPNPDPTNPLPSPSPNIPVDPVNPLPPLIPLDPGLVL